MTETHSFANYIYHNMYSLPPLSISTAIFQMDLG